eukprot:7016612-Prymnesium_polylepis.1
MPRAARCVAPARRARRTRRAAACGGGTRAGWPCRAAAAACMPRESRASPRPGPLRSPEGRGARGSAVGDARFWRRGAASGAVARGLRVHSTAATGLSVCSRGGTHPIGTRAPPPAWGSRRSRGRSGRSRRSA